MDLSEFEKRAHEAFASIPPRFRERVDGPHVERAAKEHEHVPGTYVLGECHHHPDWTGESPLFSSVFLYYGSFLAIARRDPGFDVAAEIVETVLHEVQHHVEDAAGIDRLRDLDWAEDQNGRRVEGLDFAPRFWRAGTDLGAGLFRVGPDLFLELPLRRAGWQKAHREGLTLDVLGAIVEVPADAVPAPEGHAALVFDWDWSDVPAEVRAGDGHAHDEDDASWGDLVIVLETRALPNWPGATRVVS